MTIGLNWPKVSGRKRNAPDRRTNIETYHLDVICLTLVNVLSNHIRFWFVGLVTCSTTNTYCFKDCFLRHTKQKIIYKRYREKCTNIVIPGVPNNLSWHFTVIASKILNCLSFNFLQHFIMTRNSVLKDFMKWPWDIQILHVF